QQCHRWPERGDRLDGKSRCGTGEYGDVALAALSNAGPRLYPPCIQRKARRGCSPARSAPTHGDPAVVCCQTLSTTTGCCVACIPAKPASPLEGEKRRAKVAPCST